MAKSNYTLYCAVFGNLNSLLMHPEITVFKLPGNSDRMDPSNPAPIDMRRTKLKASEAALIAGELVKPTWASRNEGIHERISFEDTLWGFEMAGGAYYKTPLRVVYVKPGSRAELACIRMGDTVLRINDQDTSELTLEEAHKLVLEAGINLKIAVTSPDDQVNAYYNYEDPVNEENVLTPEQLKEMEIERVRKALERARRCQELPWPWVRRKWTIYKESNCFMVPSKYENKHREKFPELPAQQSDYFFPVEKVKREKSSKIETNNVTNTKENEVSEQLADDEEFEEIEEEVEEEEEEEEEDVENKGVYHQEGSKRLENENTEVNSNSSENKNSNLNQEENIENSISNSEQVENINENINLEDTQRKYSDQGSVSNYEIDNNNNHVVKSKDDQINEIHQDPENSTDNKIIDEIDENSSSLVEGDENVKSDDDIIDSVLNDNFESRDSENER